MENVVVTDDVSDDGVFDETLGVVSASPCFQKYKKKKMKLFALCLI